MSSPRSNEPLEDAPAIEERRGFSRRRLIGAAGVTAAVVGAAGAGALAGRASAAADESVDIHRAIPFRGDRQAGIVTPQQDRMHFCAFDVFTDSRDAIVAMLREWTQMAERMTAGQETVPNGCIGKSVRPTVGHRRSA